MQSSLGLELLCTAWSSCFYFSWTRIRSMCYHAKHPIWAFCNAGVTITIQINNPNQAFTRVCISGDYESEWDYTINSAAIPQLLSRQDCVLCPHCKTISKVNRHIHLRYFSYHFLIQGFRQWLTAIYLHYFRSWEDHLFFISESFLPPCFQLSWHHWTVSMAPSSQHTGHP